MAHIQTLMQTTMHVLLVITAIMFPVGCGCENGPTETIAITDAPFVLEVVTTRAAIERGLGGRSEVARNGGMLFVFPDVAPRRFWMKDCLVDIDIMYLDGLGRITAIHTMSAEPLQGDNETKTAYEQRLRRYPSVLGAQFAIELKAGRIDELGLAQGDKIDIPADCLKARVQ